jgi:hypothetical protein
MADLTKPGITLAGTMLDRHSGQCEGLIVVRRYPDVDGCSVGM